MFDPTLPADHAPNSAAQMRGQLTALKALIDGFSGITAAQVDAVNTLPPGTPATVSAFVSGGTLHLTLSLPQGQTGPQGSPGAIGQPELDAAIAGTPSSSNAVATISQVADGVYSQSQFQTIINKIDELIQALRR